MVEFAEEVFDDKLITEMLPMLLNHKEELCVYADFKFKPDWDLYKAMHASGVLRAYTARDNTVLVGYAIFTMGPNPHYGETIHADQDVLYLDPCCRGKLVGLQLIKYCDNKLTKLGVTVVAQHVKTANDFGPLLERLGYTMTKKIYERRLN